MKRRDFLVSVAVSAAFAMLPALPDISVEEKEDWTVDGETISFEVEAPFKWTTKVFTATRVMTVREIRVWTRDHQHEYHNVFDRPVHLAMGDSFSITFKWLPEMFGL